MTAFVELIKRIGIFMIAAQALIHFAPGQKYEKYIRMIVGVMILLQFLGPMHQILAKTSWEERNWKELIDTELSGKMPQIGEASQSVTDTVVKEMEEEIKSRLNAEMKEENYRVVSVKVSMETREGEGEYGKTQYELGAVRVVVRRINSFDAGVGSEYADKIEKVQVQKIDVTLHEDNIQSEGAGMEENGGKTEADERVSKERELKERFCRVLGMEEKYMEVSVYGTVDENNG